MSGPEESDDVQIRGCTVFWTPTAVGPVGGGGQVCISSYRLSPAQLGGCRVRAGLRLSGSQGASASPVG